MDLSDPSPGSTHRVHTQPACQRSLESASFWTTGWRFSNRRSHIHFDLRQFVQEAKDPTPIKDKGWQDALQAAYPLKIDRFAIRNGDLTYVDKGPYKPLHITKLNFTTENIRNVKSAKGVYPSPVHLEGVVFDKGNAKFKGDADFLAKPHIALKGDLELDQIILGLFQTDRGEI